MLHLCETRLRRADVALTLDRARIVGDLAAAGLQAKGAVRALGIRVGADLDLSYAKLWKADGYALNLDGAEVTGAVFARDLEADGEVSAVGVRFLGQLDLSAALLGRAHQGDAFTLEAAEISRSVLAEGLVADGQVAIHGVRIGGILNLRAATLRNAYGFALSLDRSEIAEDVWARGLRAEGAIRALGARIGGILDLTRATLRKPVVPNVHGNVTGREGARVTNEMTKHRYALRLDAAEIAADVWAQGLEVVGELRAKGARFGGSLDLSKAKLCNRDGDALNLESSSVERLKLGSVVDIRGQLHLYRSAIADLTTETDRPPKPLVATGWAVRDIHGPLREDWAAARLWLKTTSEKSAQPWVALAEVYERNGEPAAARRLHVAAANRVTKNAPLWAKPLRTTYLCVAGHGYYPMLAAFWLVMVAVLATGIVDANQADFVSNHNATDIAAITYLQRTHTPTPTPTALQPFSYALSALLPTAVGNATSDWTVTATWLTITLTGLKLTAWILTALLLAGVTGLLRKA